MLIPVVLLVGVVAWLGIRGLLARSELQQTEAMIQQLRTALTAFDVPAAEAAASELAGHSEAARSLTGDPVWRVAELVPIVGPNFRVSRELAELADDTVDDVVLPLVEVAGVLKPESLLPVDGTIPLAPFDEAAPQLSAAADALQAIGERAQRIDSSAVLEPVRTGADRLTGLVARTLPLVSGARDVSNLIPQILGADGPRRYIVMFLNNAELRSLGGTALSFAVLDFDGGHFVLTRTVTANATNFDAYAASVIPLPEMSPELYLGGLGTFVANATLRPSFPTAGQIMHEMWLRQFGENIDGVISIDPVALSYMLRGTAPMTLSTGDAVDSGNIVAFLLNQVLQRFNSGDVVADNAAQDAVYSEVVAQTFARISGGALDPASLLTGGIQAWTERRVSFWSAHEDEQTVLAKNHLDRELIESDADTVRLGLYVNDNVGSKLNFFLTTALDTATTCSADGIESRVTFGLTNVLQPDQVANLSPSVVGQWKREQLQPGQQRLIVLLYGTPEGAWSDVTVDGAPVELRNLIDDAHPVERLIVVVEPGKTVVVTGTFRSASTARSVEVETTPMVVPVVTTGTTQCAADGDATDKSR